jgi:iron complex outermembrane receptor protein
MIVLPGLLLFSQFVFAQNHVITGKVTDAAGTGVPGVTVTGQPGNAAAVSGSDGTYNISVSPSVTSLTFSSVGYVTRQVAINGQSVINVSLVTFNASLSEVVVVAYGTRKKSDLTGTVTSVSAKDFQKGEIASAEQLLQGKVAGMQVTSGGGSAGGGSAIHIRGTSSINASMDPLIVVDGVPVDNNGIAGSANLLNTINPDDIESMSVLKDASATALYGSRASNGVIMITTKKGTSGKVKFNYNNKYSVGQVTKKVPVLNGDQVRSIITADAAATGDNTYKKLLGTSNTDWQNQIYQNAIGFDNNISASGTVGFLPFRASVGYLDQSGILKTNTFNRVSTALNLSPKFLDNHLSVNMAVKYSHTKYRFAEEGAIGSAASFDPTQPVYSGKNQYGGYYQWLQPNGLPVNTNGGSVAPNPLDLLYLRNNRSNVDRVIGNIQVDYKLHFFPDLHVIVNLGTDNAFGSGNDNIDSSSVTNWQTKGHFVYYKQGKVNNLADVSLFYTKDLKSIKSKIDVLALHSYQDFYTKVYNYPAFKETGDTIPGSKPNFATDKPEYRLESYLGRLNYSYADKYLITASIRRDASSKFSPQNRVGYFPAVAAAWRLNEEFFKNNRVVNDLKLRLGWGVTGQQDGIAYYSYMPIYSLSTITAQYQFGNAFYQFLRPAAYDKNLKWETTTTSNIGLDFAFLNNRISGSIDAYYKKTKDMLFAIPIAPGANFDITLLTNVGNMENKGVEFTLNTVPVQTKTLTWNFGFNVAYNKGTMLNLLKYPDPNFKGIDVSNISGGTGNYIGKLYVGQAPFTYFPYQQIYDPKTGAPIQGLYEDKNRNGQTDDGDRYFYKKPAPDVLFGINTSVNYLKWSIGFAAHGALGNYLYNNFVSNSSTLRNMKDPLLLIRNVSANYLATQFTNNQYLSDYYIENASYFRLDNINIGYNVGRIFNNKAALRIAGGIQNVFVITKYKGMDPENASVTGVDNNIYPRPRVVSMGLNLDF